MTFSDHRVISDILGLEHIVQTTGIMHSKNIIIDTLRHIFAQDREYAYKTDIFGFPKTPSHLGLDPAAGLDDEETTRIFIGSSYRYDIKFNPSIIVRNSGSRYIPISFNQDLMSIVYRQERVIDGYGNETIIYSPHAHTRVGAWDQTIEVKVIAESSLDREEIADIVKVCLMGSRRLELQREGVFIKGLSTSGESEEQYANDYLYIISINLDIRSEWKIQIPINNVVERIGFCLTFNDRVASDPPATGLNISERLDLVDQL